MKTTTMKKTLLGLAALLLVSLLGFNQEVKAQLGDNQAEATAQIVQQIQIERITSLEFGLLVPDETKSILVTGAPAGTPSVTSPTSAARFTITKSGIPVTFTLALPSVLDGLASTPTEGETLALNFDDTADGDNPNLGLVTDADGTNTYAFTPVDGASVDLETEASAFDTLTTFDIVIGGTVVASDTQVAGNYRGVITLTVDYN
ncbi:hypothetical protein CYPRO_1121 [Cyclonatronum proteinivorum]|uniref:DUF4402 domain-containing protein n=1 Tax=Cyclonatronum proteinivorum TaxID=1457365 RepID=A0A345UIT4_9BACT|nr:hypothetical protein [Cyclonatronum proteinivorum]AXJ00386.1 hypothetical protein CYPRO_1121 [Cyclonatronum proteinivorum]